MKIESVPKEASILQNELWITRNNVLKKAPEEETASVPMQQILEKVTLHKRFLSECGLPIFGGN